MNSGRHAQFCSDGILRIGRVGTMVPAATLCSSSQRSGVPWWLAVLPVAIQEGAQFTNVLRCLLPWSESIGEGTGVDLHEWIETLRPRSDTPRLVMLMELHSDLGAGDRWNAFVRGTQDEDFGNPDEMPFDVLGACEVKLSKRRLVVSVGEEGEPPFIDAGHPDAFLTWPWGGRKAVGIWTDSSPPGFSDFVCNCLFSICLKHVTPSRTALRMLENSNQSW